MEKFAVDLDKVLDDFELDEDESESVGHYEKLQLQFCPEGGPAPSPAPAPAPIPTPAPTPALPSHGAGLGAFGGWSEPLQPQVVAPAGDGVRGWCGMSQQPLPQPPRARSPPDGQNDDTQAPAACSQHPPSIVKEDVVDANAHPSNPPGSSALWPALASQPSLRGSYIPPGDARLVSPPEPPLAALGEAGGCGGLDVVPASVPPDRGLAGGHEGRHPDIIDVWQSSGDGPPPAVQPSPSPPGPPPSSGLAEGGRVGQEVPRLPDLMGGSSLEPAIVVENTLAQPHPHSRPQDPAIVVESRPAHRLPEVANVHQTAESHGLGPPAPEASQGVAQDEADAGVSAPPPQEHQPSSCDTPPNQDPAPLTQQASTTPPPPPHEASGHSATPPQSPAPVPQAAAPHLTPPASPTPPAQPLSFSKNMDIGDADLDAELAELEEEQVRLQGAYGGVGGPSPPHGLLQHHPSPKASPDLIGGASTSHEHREEDMRNGETVPIAGSPSDVAKSPPDSPCNPTDSLHSPPDSSSDSPSSPPDPSRSPTDTPAVPGLPGHHDQDSPFLQHPGIAGLEEVVCQPHHTPGEDTVGERGAGSGVDGTGDNVSTGSLNTDTLSSSSTLTDPGSPDRQPQQPPPHHPVPQSPTRVTPGTLVTAVYDDDSGSGREDDPSAQLPETPPPPPPPGSRSAASLVGHVAPFWIPDEDAPNCQECGQKFTVIRRRHHCRACGRVLCAPCCHHRAALPYMDHKEARVCTSCLQILQSSQDEGAEGSEGRWGSRGEGSSGPRRVPDPNNPMDYCSRVPPPQQAAAAPPVPPPTVMVPVGVLKREGSSSSSSGGGGGSGGGNTRTRGSKQVMFSDGIRPGGDLSEPALSPPAPYCRTGRSARRVERPACEYVFEDNPDSSKLEEQMRGDGPPVIFAIHKNLTVLVKLVKLECCVGVEVWNLATRGLCTVGQEELVVLLEVAPGETHPPRDLFAFFHTVYQQANQGNLVTELGHTIFTESEGLLGSREHGGFLYVRPTFQCLRNLVLPPSPYIFAVLIQKWETPWAKVFPLRLMLRMGAEFRYYPCPLVSTRNRKPVFCEIGHTIMNLLVDFRNYAYTVPAIEGFVIHMEDKKTSLLFPKNRYEQVTKALSNSNDHVLALGANFSPQADSHLVTIENDDGHYSTQAINIHSRPRKVTGASFIVFNGALKTTSGLSAKSSIVEDGLMVQIPADMMAKLRDALQNMRDFDIPCGPTSAPQPDEMVVIRWTSDDKNFNVGIKSPVDEKQMDGVPSVKIHSGTDYISNSHLIRWTEVFILQGETNNTADINLSRLSELLARSFCVALTPHLSELYTTGHTRLGLRTTLHQDNVGYEAGSGGARLAPACMNDLDNELVPVIHRAASNITQQPIILELVFHIMEQ
uniref:FYVE-type domain-containing protein n=1 Tax=Scylla olivacea TaxID=85551 RepID=A0A0P4WC83_SCYOL